jgi:hypothetical protein
MPERNKTTGAAALLRRGRLRDRHATRCIVESPFRCQQPDDLRDEERLALGRRSNKRARAKVLDQRRQRLGKSMHGLVENERAALGAQLAQDVEAEVRRHFPQLVFDTVIPRNVRLGEAPSYGRPVIHHDPHCAGADAYFELAKEVAQRG